LAAGWKIINGKVAASTAKLQFRSELCAFLQPTGTAWPLARGFFQEAGRHLQGARWRGREEPLRLL
jgi:hypothetical protein